MYSRILLSVLILLFLIISAFGNIYYVKSSWLLFFLYGAVCIGLNALIFFLWTRDLGLGRWQLLVYVLLFAGMCLLKLHVFDAILNAHRADAGLNHLLNLLKSPVPLMLLIPSAYLRKAG